jgi:type VI protein secretion system component VasK
MTEFYLHDTGLGPLSKIHNQVSSQLGALASPQVADVATSLGNIAFGVNTALESVMQSRSGAHQSTQKASDTIADLLNQAQQLYVKGDLAGADKLKAAAEALESQQAAGGSGTAAAASGAGGGGGGGDMMGQVMGQLGQLAQTMTQPLQGLAQPLQQIPQQVMQGVQQAVQQATQAAGGLGGGGMPDVPTSDGAAGPEGSERAPIEQSQDQKTAEDQSSQDNPSDGDQSPTVKV